MSNQLVGESMAEIDPAFTWQFDSSEDMCVTVPVEVLKKIVREVGKSSASGCGDIQVTLSLIRYQCGSMLCGDKLVLYTSGLATTHRFVAIYPVVEISAQEQRRSRPETSFSET